MKAQQEGVALHLVSLSTTPDELARLRCHLSEDELRRGNRLIDQDRRDRFFVGRGLLRQVLAGYLGAHPSAVPLAEGEFGKPYLAGETSRGGLRFNASHAGDLLLVAVAAGREVGCDLEQLRKIPFRGMAERYFSKRECGELFGLPPEQQLPAFYRCWTSKEAYLKGTGTGFSQSTADFDVSVLPEQAPELLCHRGDPEEPTRWELRDVEVPEGYVAALAVKRVYSR